MKIKRLIVRAIKYVAPRIALAIVVGLMVIGLITLIAFFFIPALIYYAILRLRGKRITNEWDKTEHRGGYNEILEREQRD